MHENFKQFKDSPLIVLDNKKKRKKVERNIIILFLYKRIMIRNSDLNRWISYESRYFYIPVIFRFMWIQLVRLRKNTQRIKLNKHGQ